MNKIDNYNFNIYLSSYSPGSKILRKSQCQPMTDSKYEKYDDNGKIVKENHLGSFFDTKV